MSRIEGSDALNTAKLEVAAVARRELLIRVASLDMLPRSQSFLEALVNLAKVLPQSRTRVLYNSLDAALETGHPLIGLRRRLSSSFFLQQCDERDATSRVQWWLADRFTLLHIPDETRPIGMLDTDAKAQGPRHQEEFEDAWQRSHEDPQLRDIFI